MKEKVLDILEEVCVDDAFREDLDLNLFDSGLLDSLAVAELIVELEEQLGIELPLTEVNREDIDTPNKLINYLKEKGD